LSPEKFQNKRPELVTQSDQRGRKKPSELLPYDFGICHGDGVVVLNRTPTNTDCPDDLASVVSQGNTSRKSD
jgi:hypothetical protein